MKLSAEQIKTDPCDLFTGPVNDRGHGVTMFNGQKEYAHRVPFLQRGVNLGPLDIVHHKCGNKRCVNFSHLVIVSWSDHSKFHARGEENSQAKLTEDKVRRIRKLHEQTKLPHSVIADLFDVSKQTVTKIVNRNTWKHI